VRKDIPKLINNPVLGKEISGMLTECKIPPPYFYIYTNVDQEINKICLNCISILNAVLNQQQKQPMTSEQTSRFVCFCYLICIKYIKDSFKKENYAENETQYKRNVLLSDDFFKNIEMVGGKNVYECMFDYVRIDMYLESFQHLGTDINVSPIFDAAFGKDNDFLQQNNYKPIFENLPNTLNHLHKSYKLKENKWKEFYIIRMMHQHFSTCGMINTREESVENLVIAATRRKDYFETTPARKIINALKRTHSGSNCVIKEDKDTDLEYDRSEYSPKYNDDVYEQFYEAKNEDVPKLIEQMKQVKFTVGVGGDKKTLSCSENVGTYLKSCLITKTPKTRIHCLYQDKIEIDASSASLNEDDKQWLISFFNTVIRERKKRNEEKTKGGGTKMPKKNKSAVKAKKETKVYTGPLGGKYVLRKGRKVYV